MTSKLTSLPRMVSGMRPTGALHLGNYYGALKNWVTLQHDYDCYFSIVDLHALTTQYEHPASIRKNTWEMLIDWLAAGVDPEKSHIFIQSWVPEHAELHTLLSMITPVPWLERVPTYKDQQSKLSELDLSTYGFLGYPVLQSADVLLYKGIRVPVGEDQVAHIELLREIARRFNHLYGPVFPEPQAVLTSTPKLPGIDGQKMSKSYHNTIGLREAPESVHQKIRVMPTDPARIKRTDPGTPEKCPVWDLHQVFSTPDTRSKVQEGCRSASIGCIECKRWVSDAIVQEQAPIIERAQSYENNPALLREVAVAGAEAARAAAKKTLDEVKHVMGLELESADGK